MRFPVSAGWFPCVRCLWAPAERNGKSKAMRGRLPLPIFLLCRSRTGVQAVFPRLSSGAVFCISTERKGKCMIWSMISVRILIPVPTMPCLRGIYSQTAPLPTGHISKARIPLSGACVTTEPCSGIRFCASMKFLHGTGMIRRKIHCCLFAAGSICR